MIGVIGLGKLGLCLAAIFSKHFQVYGVDLSEERVKQVQNRERFFEPQLNEFLEKYGENLHVSTDYTLLKDCKVVFIITQTPSLPSGKFDTKYVESALTELHKVNPKCLAVISSTINIGDIDRFKNIHERIAYNPEFIRQGSIIHDFLNPKFLLIGAETREDGERIAKIWRQIHSKPIYLVKPVEAEIIKLSLNVSFTLGIIFANMIGEICEKFSADSNKVLDVIYQDRRNYKAGLGFAGPCFPRDVECFKAICNELNVKSGYDLACLLSSLNNYTIERYLQKLEQFDKIGILGVAYKPNVPYIYESQPIKIAQQLLEKGREIHIYDPLAEQNAREVLNGKVHFHSTMEKCIENSEVIFIGTPNFSNIRINKPIINPWK